MSLQRLIFYSALIGGWAAFVGWLLSEILFLHRSDNFGFILLLLTAGLVGAAIGGGLNLLVGIAIGSWRGHLPRLFVGMGLGFAGGCVGALVGNLIYTFLPRALGWMIMGMGIGSVEGIYDGSTRKIRNGLIGGGIGGLLGGFLFDPIGQVIGSAMSSRATAFVILGLCIGLCAGLAQVILKEAWLTVEEGFRPGRQLLLGQAVVTMGTSEKVQLPFIAIGAKGVEPVHLQVVRQDDGSFMLEDNQSRTGTFLNGAQIKGPSKLKDNDIIGLGPNKVRFREAFRTHKEQSLDGKVVSPATSPAVPSTAASSAVKPAATAPAPVPAGVSSAIKPAPAASPPRPAAPSPAPVGIKPAPVPQAPRPVAPAPAAPAPQAAGAPAGQQTAPAATTPAGCPICGRVGKPVAKSAKRFCPNCEIHYG